jgi:hypothetical protein
VETENHAQQDSPSMTSHPSRVPSRYAVAREGGVSTGPEKQKGLHSVGPGSGPKEAEKKQQEPEGGKTAAQALLKTPERFLQT